MIVFSLHDSLEESERVVARLAAIGCTARVARAIATDVPGIQRRRRAGP